MSLPPWPRAAARLALLLCVAARVGAAQQPTPQPGTPRPLPPKVEAPPPRTAAPTPQAARPADQRSGAARDTTGRGGRDDRKTLINWAPDDSVMEALLKRAGYSVVRYQADTVGFESRTRTMSLATTDTAKAAVQRDSTLLVARNIVYNDSTKMIAARGDTIVMRDPARGEDVTGLMEMTYDLARREGRTRDLSTIANSGEDWQVRAHRAAFATDTTSDRNTLYGRDGLITSCLDSVPHYHFLAKELKRVSGSVIVARPAILYVADVPVMWLPFIFQDIRTGRRSGLLTPRAGFSEVVRNSPTYRRTVENLGYYFALTDYVDAQVSMDWRSRARETDFDPGWVRLNGELRYRWLNQFLSGTVALSRNSLSNGSRNTALSWSHVQEFSSRTRFSTNINYVTNTQVQRQSVINPMMALATISSQANFARQQGPFSINLGGTQRQYPGRDQVDRDFPSLNIASKPLTVGEWFVVTPTFSFTNSQRLNLDAIGDFTWRYVDGPGGLDSTRLRRDSRNTSLSVATPFKIFDFQVQSDFRYTDNANDFPEIKTIADPLDPTQSIDRVYARTYKSAIDYNVAVGLPQFFKGSWNFAPIVSLSNVDPAGSFVRSERTSGAWVGQAKRFNYGAGVAPTFFRLFPGIGPVERMRHAISPTLTWSYSPAITVNPDYLEALGKSPVGYLGGLAQNRLTLGFATNVEARLRPRRETRPGAGRDAPVADSAVVQAGGAAAPAAGGAGGTAEGRKLRVVSLQFSPITYDFERKRQTGGSGFATDRLGYTFRSDLLPGFDLGVDYSLFQGSVLSDTAVFKPYRESVRFGFDLNRNSALVRYVSGLFGSSLTPGQVGTADDSRRDAMGGGLVSGMMPGAQGMGSVTGTRGRGAVQEIPTGQGFTASFSVSQQRQRPPVGGRVVTFDPREQCRDLEGQPAYNFCIAQAEQNRPTDLDQGNGTVGGTVFRVPPTTSVGIRTSFNLTPRWAASWNTTYDVERSQFAAQVVTLQRDLHDWRAIFGFTQAPNGNFAFTFFISLKAQPEIKLDYDRQTFRQPNVPFTR